MKELLTNRKSKSSKPVKVLLHMALKNNRWSGRATLINQEVSYIFRSMEDLTQWLAERYKEEKERTVK
jgi:hypothetical protein